MSEAELVSALLALSPKKRAEIAGILLRSLEVGEADKAKEIERRVEQIRDGTVRTLPGAPAMKRLRRKLQGKRTDGGE
ncbi:MAG TPA: addiction module protein [Myxococcales bacterium]